MLQGSWIPLEELQSFNLKQSRQEKRSIVISQCVNSVRVWSFSGPYFSEFELNMERVSLSIQSESGEIRTRKTPNTDSFHAVSLCYSLRKLTNFKMLYPLAFSLFYLACSDSARDHQNCICRVLFWCYCAHYDKVKHRR